MLVSFGLYILYVGTFWAAHLVGSLWTGSRELIVMAVMFGLVVLQFSKSNIKPPVFVNTSLHGNNKSHICGLYLKFQCQPLTLSATAI